MMFTLDHRNQLTDVSEGFADEVGDDPTALTGRPITSLVDEDDVRTVRAALAAVRSADGTKRSCACRLTTPAGPAAVELELAAVSSEDDRDVFGVVHGRAEAESSARVVTGDGERFERLFDLIHDAVIEFEIVGDEPIIRAVNPGFEDVFGYDAEAVVDEPLNEFVVPGDRGGEAAEFDQRTAAGKTNRAVVTRRTAWGRREFLYRGIPYRRESGDQCGFAMYSDITTQKQSREHLQVLHRVLRHNLRNELNVVVGRAEEISETTSRPSVRRAAAQIVEHADLLLTTSEKAREAASVVDDPSDSRVDVAAQLRSVVDTYRNTHPDVTIETDLPSALHVAVGSRLGQALGDLIENAVEHAGADPTVRVTATERTDEAVVTVADDGPGIPEGEWAAVFGDEDITQLTHGSGLGLWVVKWVVESAGGRVAYERSDGWTRLVVTLPLASDVALPAADD